MTCISCTRFNNITWNENIIYRKIHNIPAIYGTDIRICSKYWMTKQWIVFEMNNDTNQIMGIGIIDNRIIFNPTHNIYNNRNYNRYIYRGNKWISRKILIDQNPDIICIMEQLLFTGRGNMKRLSGISKIPPKTLMKYNLKAHKPLFHHN